MKKSDRTVASRAVRIGAFFLLCATLLAGTTLLNNTKVEANHPVLVEGNCDSPVPGTTLVTPGTCGDYDGDGRIGTAEDTDGADRIFGTINAAMGPGTGAAAGTGANHNGLVLIVRSGRFVEPIYIGVTQQGPGSPGVANPGNVTLEAAPGVSADIDAVLQGDPTGGNTARQGQTGIAISYSANGAARQVTLRNLSVRNFTIGIGVSQNARVNIENCRLENNLNYGISLSNATRAVIKDSSVFSTGFRIGAPVLNPVPGAGILINQTAQARIVNTTVAQNAALGIFNNTGVASNVVLYKVSSFFNDGGNILGPTTACTDDVTCAN